MPFVYWGFSTNNSSKAVTCKAMKKFFTLLLTIFWLSLAIALSQECAAGTNVLHRNTSVSLSKIVSYPGGRWSSSKARYGHMVVKSKKKKEQTWLNPFQGSGRRSHVPDFPLERCAILAMTGVGVGYFTGDLNVGYRIGGPTIAVALALPFPGQQKRGRFAAKRIIGQKLIGLVAFSTSYALGLGVGQQLHFKSPTQ